jgi:LmbE family N-acetylglucosaminyl deacetylase
MEYGPYNRYACVYKYMEAAVAEVYAPSMAARSAVILSPHLDDAVLSCWHLLCGPGEVTVINVFAGSPPPGSSPSWWDQLTGATDSAARMAERRAEDRAAFAIAGRTATSLEFLDEQYEPTGQSVDEIVSALRELIDPEAVVYAPAALGDHADHEKVRSAALALAESGQRVRLYADHPHAVRAGWPAWVEGARPTGGDAVADHWDQRLGDAGLTRPRPAVHHLNTTEHQRKLRAVSAYRTQIRGLASTFGEIEGFPAFPHEIVWAVS